MYSYDQQMSQIHALLAWCSVVIFILRGLAFQFGSRWAVWALDSRLSLLVFAIGTLMTVTGLSLWALRHLNPVHDGWLLAKLLALLAYLVCAHWAMGRGEFRVLGYLAALLCLAYMMAVSVTRSAGMGLL